ncbi:MAG: hypothetical protein K0Q76_2295 [Panacagrimonas sp.]|jgi:hypothetical protein|nr:hypothetical protein [Panacagrimonas sp.]MCC2657187.1 hypothetical protein [Panacagrimonas sp.]
MQNPGPELETLLRRLIDLPPEFLLPPRIAGKGTVHTAALVNDLFAQVGHTAPEAMLRRLSSVREADRARLLLTAVVCWLLADRWFVKTALPVPGLVQVFDDAVGGLAQAADASRYVADPDRREELVRVVLARMDFRPQGETLEQATDRLSSLSAVERKRLLAASRAAEKRAREIREALARKAAEESADKWSRE